MSFSWVHYFTTEFHGYFINHEKKPNETFMHEDHENFIAWTFCPVVIAI